MLPFRASANRFAFFELTEGTYSKDCNTAYDAAPRASLASAYSKSQLKILREVSEKASVRTTRAHTFALAIL